VVISTSSENQPCSGVLHGLKLVVVVLLTPPLFCPKFLGVFLLAHITHVVVNVCRYLKLYSAVKLFLKYSDLCVHDT